MGVNTNKINLGVCDVTFNGNDMGATKGGVEVHVKTSTHEVKTDQTGETPVKEIITGTTVEVKVPMAETDLDRLTVILPQSVGLAAAAAATGYLVNLGAGYVAGATSVKIDTGAGTPAPGSVFTFAGHTTAYRVTGWNSGSGTLSFVQNGSGAGGLTGPVLDNEPLTFAARNAGVEIRSGVNVDLMSVAKELKLHPTGLDPANTDSDFTVFKAAPSPNFTFKYQSSAERIYEVTFKGYVDVDNNNRIASFGVAA